MQNPCLYDDQLIYLFISLNNHKRDYRNFKQMFIRIQLCVKEKTLKDQLDRANTKPMHLL